MYFLNKIAQYVFENEQSILAEIALVFPSKRAGLFFNQELKKLLSDASSNPTFLPKTYVIDEFFQSQTNTILANDLDLIFLLYKAYRKVYYEDSEEEIIAFDEFYPFGEMVFKDFQEIDNYLVKPEQVFSDLSLLEKIKEADMETFEQYEAVKRFILNFSQLSDSDPKQRFGFFWNRLHLLYTEFHQLLKDRNWSYPAFTYRELLKQIESDKVDIKGQKVIFAGFNALTKAEERLIDTYLKKSQTKIFWKYDDIYLGNKHNEGSRFLRYYLNRWKTNVNSIVIKNPKAKEKKQLKIYNSSSPVAQIKYVAKELENVKNEDIGKTLIVISDENLLLPFLNSIPKNIQKLNVTMGYAIRNTAFYSILISLFQLVEKTKGDKIYYKILFNFLDQLRSVSTYDNEILNIENILKENESIYLNKETVAESDDKLQVFVNQLVFKESVIEFVNSLIQLFDSIYLFDKQTVDNISYHHYRKELVKMSRIIETEKELFDSINKVFLIQILKQIAISSKVPFEGEPVEGLQIMGPLEIRVLDFDNVYMLSMNDGVYPKNSLRTSLLPYGLRKAFFLPTFETQESIYAHHFYALFQNAESIQTHYSTREGGVGASEKSRFLTQLDYEKEQYPTLRVEQNSISYEMNSVANEIDGFKSSKKIVDQLFEHYSREEKSFSPSAIGTYLECELKFYYRYIQKIYEKEEVKEELESVDIGNIIHNALELMFIDHIKIDEKILKLLISNADDYIQRGIEKSELKGSQKGYNYYLINASKKYLKRYLNSLITYLPFEVLATEKSVVVPVKVKKQSVNIGGNMDLVIHSKGSDYIIDYKTGRNPSSVIYGEDIELISTKNKKYKHYFQLLYYAMLYSKLELNNNVVAELHYILLNKRLGINPTIKDLQIESLSLLIDDILVQIFDEEKIFNKTKDEENCLNCIFKKLCNR